MVKKERMVELIKKAVEIAYNESIPPDTLVTPEIIGATEEEFSALMSFINRIMDTKDLPFDLGD